MMLKFDIVDVFTTIIGAGNPVAVVHNAGGLGDVEMQKFASWVGLPETVFLQSTRSRADYAVRIFAPSCELPFAGHPSIGALAAQLARRPAWAGRVDFLQECKAGLVSLSVSQIDGETLISVQTPKSAELRAFTAKDTFGFLSAIGLGGKHPISSQRVSAGANWAIIQLEDATDVLDAHPEQQSILELSIEHDVSGLTIFSASDASDADYVVRSFAPRIGVAEDAACGGGNACVAAVVAQASTNGVRYKASQGQKLGRNAYIFSEGPFGDRRFRIGGHTRVVISGEMNRPCDRG